MTEFTKKLASELNNIRYNYIDTNNKLYAEIQDLLNKSRNNTGIASPPLTNAARIAINEYIYFMQRKSVIALEEGVSHLINDNNRNNNNFSNSNISENNQKKFSKYVTEGLEEVFYRNSYPNESERYELAMKYNLSSRQISNWFTNKRNRGKLRGPRCMNVS